MNNVIMLTNFVGELINSYSQMLHSGGNGNIFMESYKYFTSLPSIFF